MSRLVLSFLLFFLIALPAQGEEAVIKRKNRRKNEEVLTNIPMLGNAPKGQKPVTAPIETVSFYSPSPPVPFRYDSAGASIPALDKGYTLKGDLLTNLPYVPWRSLGPTSYDSLINDACARYGMDPELIRQLIWH